jgi:chromosome segregation ATPase
MTEAKTPTLDYLLGELEHVFDDQADALGTLEGETAEMRERFRAAREELDRTGDAISEVEAELEGLPQRMTHADLRGDEEEKEKVRSRYRELNERLEGARESRREALEVFKYSDPWQVQSAAYQAAASQADSVVREAERQRAELQEALDRSFRGLDEKADRVRQYQRTHTMTRGAING